MEKKKRHAWKYKVRNKNTPSWEIIFQHYCIQINCKLKLCPAGFQQAMLSPVHDALGHLCLSFSRIFNLAHIFHTAVWRCVVRAFARLQFQPCNSTRGIFPKKRLRGAVSSLSWDHGLSLVCRSEICTYANVRDREM